MNTKQLTVLWYGVLAAVAILLVQGEGEVWPSLGAVALVTAALIYTLGPMHAARLGRVAVAVAAPFVLAGLGIAAFHGYRSWQHSVAVEAVTVQDVQVAKKPNCPMPVDSTELGRLGEATDEPSLTRAVARAKQLSQSCHLVEGTLHNSSDADLQSVTIEIMVSDTVGQLLSESVRLQSVQYEWPGKPLNFTAEAGAEVEFSKSVHLPEEIGDQQVDSVRVREVEVSE